MNDFENYIQELLCKFKALNLDDLKLKTINYGKQFILLRQKDKAVLSIYNGKKGRKIVWGGSESLLQTEAMNLVSGKTGIGQKYNVECGTGEGKISLLEDLPGFDYLWVGSDESGKGDFFGPLVVASVMVNKQIALELINIGVKDSKTLKDIKINELAGMIEKIAPNNIVLALKPEAYNLRYQQLKEKKQNLNNLLANGHIAVLSKALEANKQCRFALVDRFTVKNNIADLVQRNFPWVTIVQQPKAEADVAVAAASILARAKFVKVMDELSTFIGVELPKGGGKAATECAKNILLQHGEEKLAKLVKMHFANYKVLFSQDTL
jgi:ribonuclease HIII